MLFLPGPFSSLISESYFYLARLAGRCVVVCDVLLSSDSFKNIMFAGCSEKYSRGVQLTCGVRISSGVIYKGVLDSAIMF